MPNLRKKPDRQPPALNRLFFSFLRLGTNAFGGPAMIAYIRELAVEREQWLRPKTFQEGVALCQTIPGAIVITATFVGYLLHGLFGAFLTTVAIFLPSLLLLIGIAPHFARLCASPLVNRGVDGILCSFVGLLGTVTIRLALHIHWDWPRLLLAGAAFAALRAKVDLLWVILAGATVAGFLF